jgi:hypothetical protein
VDLNHWRRAYEAPLLTSELTRNKLTSFLSLVLDMLEPMERFVSWCSMTAEDYDFTP